MKLADMRALEARARKGVQVQILSSAPNYNSTNEVSMKTIKISRKKWLAGDREYVASCLWNPDLKQGCCLGHVIHQTARVSWDALSLKGTPISFYKGHKTNCLVTKEEDGRLDNSAFAYKAMSINDNYFLSRKQKEGRLITLFKENGFKLVFVP